MMVEKELFDLLVKAESKKELTKDEKSFLLENLYIDQLLNPTEKLINELEPYRVKRAIIMAAGFGSRMVPVTLTTPKPLVRVNGIRFIDTQIKKLVDLGIKDITIVRGYLKQKFDELLIDYPFLKFVDNDSYNEENNIASAILVKDLLQNAYLCEGDFFVTGDDVYTKYQFDSNYLGTPVDETDDWCFDVDENRITSNYRKGGKKCAQAFGISYWNKKDGKFLAEKLAEMYANKANRQSFWEMCIFDVFKDEFAVKCRFVKKESLVEIDSFDELTQIDKSYLKLKNE